MLDVIACRETLTIPTYGLGKPERNPLFFEKRVYQASCGKVYPLPFIDKLIQDEPPVLVDYQSVRLENEYVRLVMLPEIGGRIFRGQDKANNDYDFFYRQDVIKPALVGLAGPWISGGVEFNWPQHHRPGTYLPTDFVIEEEPDGSRTVWMSEHDPLNRLKGMHGIRLRPGSALIELRVRLFNRTPFTRTFLWWANVAAKVHDQYQSFFPPDVHYVADHAVRAMSSFPIANNDYYGVDYAARPGANDLTRYQNIPVPTSYMVCQTEFDFFGGYDDEKQGGFVHVANKHISPGKKQWTWGNHAFGWAWDRELTDTNGPYIELMAGVYTDNQPDFSYLLPYETKKFSQFWWPYQQLGPVQQSNEEAALRLVLGEDLQIDLGLAVSRRREGLRVILRDGDRVQLEATVAADPANPWRADKLRFGGGSPTSLYVAVYDNQDRLIIAYRPVDTSRAKRDRSVATEPPPPHAALSCEELFLTGEHLEQYRHPTRLPEPYWEEAIRRDPGDARCRIALGRRALERGCVDDASEHLQHALKRLTFRHPNPVTGEAHYYLGVTRRFQQRFDEAYPLFYKATWNFEWSSAAYFELTCLDLLRADYATALAHAEASLDTNRQNGKAYVLKAICLRHLGKSEAAQCVLQELLDVDPLDHWARAEKAALSGRARLDPLSRNDAQTAIDVAFDYTDAWQFEDAASVLQSHHESDVTPVAVPNPLARTQMTHYTLAWILHRQRQDGPSRSALEYARSLPADYCFPSRLHEQVVLAWACEQPGADRNAAYGLGNYFYDRRRHEDAIAAWEQAREADPRFATVHRNLGIAYWNVRRDGEQARRSYLSALKCDPNDARLIAEYAQLSRKLNDPADQRLAFLESHRSLTLDRDDAAVELATLYNETGRPEAALELLAGRTFHPWEGGEGRVIRQYTTARLLLGRRSLESGVADAALDHFEQAMQTPHHLGEKYHLLQAKADVAYWQGRAWQSLGREAEAAECFMAAAKESSDFQSMAVTAFSELSYYRGLALRALGRDDEAAVLFDTMKSFAEREMRRPATLDYFATSLPNLLVFDDDLDASHQTAMQRIHQLAEKGRQEDTDIE